MCSGADKIMRNKIDNSVAARELSAAMQHWENFTASSISHHGERCCEVARQWLLAMDFSQLHGATPLTGPRWLRQKFKWGPSPWPIYWCEVVRRKTIDCGALGALAHQIFLARGVRSFTAQFILEFTEDSAEQWLAAWKPACTTGLNWVRRELIYHEGCAVAAKGGELKLWDATASWWIDPKQFRGYSAVRAVRIFDTTSTSETEFRWGAHRIRPNRWCEIAPPKSFTGKLPADIKSARPDRAPSYEETSVTTAR